EEVDEDDLLPDRVGEPELFAAQRVELEIGSGLARPGSIGGVLAHELVDLQRVRLILDREVLAHEQDGKQHDPEDQHARFHGFGVRGRGRPVPVWSRIISPFGYTDTGLWYFVAVVFMMPGETQAEAPPASARTPREIVAELDKFVIGQKRAKKAVAIALRNRWRRQRLSPEMAREILPKNILMIGPTGVGKTEIARRLARLA